MAAPPEREGYEGLANLANAIRRSTALYVAAAYVCGPEDSTDELEQVADRLARWLGGKTQHQEESQQGESGSPLGKPWPPED